MSPRSRQLKLEDIAALAGVSRSTASRVVNNDARVSDEVRTRVKAVMAEHRFQPNAAGRNLARSRSHIIALVFPRVFTTMFTDPWASVLIRGCIDGAEQADLSLVNLLVTSTDDHAVDKFLSRYVMGRHIDGVIMASHMFGDRLVARLQEIEFPYILVGRDQHLQANFVDIDNRRAAKVATTHLLDHGYRRLMHLSGPSELITAVDREAGFRDALAERGLDAGKARVECGDFDQLNGYTIALRVLQEPDRPDAIFAGDDAMAIGAIQAARELGLSVPGDVAIIGFDDIDMNRAFRPELSTVRQPSDVMGRLAVESLVDIMANPPPAPVQRWLPAELIVRRSCGCSFIDPKLPDSGGRKERAPIESGMI